MLGGVALVLAEGRAFFRPGAGPVHVTVMARNVRDCHPPPWADGEALAKRSLLKAGITERRL